MTKNYYITTTLPYVNADPHIGFALEIIQADALARYHALKGDAVFFNTGTDEHGAKIQEKADAEGRDVQGYVDHFADIFRKLKGVLNLYPDIHFIRTTDANHIKAAREFWNLCLAKGDIYKKAYQTQYCTGCELQKTDSELNEDGGCPLHPGKQLQIIDEENYFFRYSAYEKPLLDFFAAHPDFIIPESRYNEIKKFVEGGLEDFSISRLKSKMAWGIPVPNDDEQVMYVWFDALVSYVSTLGWSSNQNTGESAGGNSDASASGNDAGRLGDAGSVSTDQSQFNAFWPGVQVAGKDQVRMQAGMWQAMLMSAGIPNSKQIYFHGFLNMDGQKMSKSIGNVANPYDIVNEYGADPLRYYLLREIHPYEDGDYAAERFKEAYNANLANGIGNLLSRVLKMAISYEVSFDGMDANKDELFIKLESSLNAYNFSAAMDVIWQSARELDAFIQEHAPFKTIKTDPEKAKADIAYLLNGLYKIAFALQPFLPKTAEEMIKFLETKTFPEAPLFMRRD